ncbi:MAG: patatin-like phospholipase family protein, partial [Planctomycetota bacterium]|nr:patatin-like phospholipase family protein [Planctomycetota bacterium]
MPQYNNHSSRLRLPSERGSVRPRTVLVLGGGGMRGMAHVGVLKALRTLGIQLDSIIGTSIGSLVGTMAAAGMSIEEMERTITSVQKGDYFKLNVVKFLLKGVRAPSMYSGETFRARLTEILPEGSFDCLDLPFFCNSVR